MRKSQREGRMLHPDSILVVTTHSLASLCEFLFRAAGTREDKRGRFVSHLAIRHTLHSDEREGPRVSVPTFFVFFFFFVSREFYSFVRSPPPLLDHNPTPSRSNALKSGDSHCWRFHSILASPFNFFTPSPQATTALPFLRNFHFAIASTLAQPPRSY